MSAAVSPSPQRPLYASGRLANGHFGVSKGLSLANTWRLEAGIKPFRTFSCTDSYPFTSQKPYEGSSVPQRPPKTLIAVVSTVCMLFSVPMVSLCSLHPSTHSIDAPNNKLRPGLSLLLPPNLRQSRSFTRSTSISKIRLVPQLKRSLLFLMGSFSRTATLEVISGATLSRTFG